ncbi:sugar MFS transporter [Croceicoccus naphthovorans]|uniref:Glucose transporter n=1 Tax=Croceicoccus naphthovorans TaxID=1348774 RepID=A0A0G3XIC2_9SPHN|nr:sugar MFS transporter [Croceicoccus naphthovorans]AKM10371.1 glucose transporter [Croceicoccus naphthovorans]MBB3990065.1 FHS family L-fucose permease-like MFS transporter [Croceicoccus naphthovorans]
MAIAPDIASSTDPNPIEDEGTHIDAPGLQPFVFALFFIFGGITSLNDVVIPKLKELFTLNYTQAMLVQFCFFAAYFVMGLPMARLVKKVGYMRGAVIGLITMMAGCLMFIPASQTATYAIFLFAYFVLASGVVMVQVVANPLISLLGPQRTAHSRLTFGQAFNSLGTTVFPAIGAGLILGKLADVSADQLTGEALRAYRTAESNMIVNTYLGLAVAIGVVALAVWLFRNRLQGENHEESSLIGGLSLLKRSRFGFGALSIFLYVGAEVSIGSILINYLAEARVFGQPESVIGWMITLYWGGAMVGRFIGSALLRVFSPGKILAFNAAAAIALIAISALSSGAVAGYSLLAVGLMNSIMFPTIFALACEKLGSRAADGSGIINVAIVGGAVVPVVFGVLADVTGSLALALILPAICYAIIAGFGVFARRPA